MSLQPDSTKQVILHRLHLLSVAITLLFLILAARLWQLQIIQGPEYTLKSEQNRVRTIQVLAPRGTILDRNKVPIVENRPSFNVLLYREAVKNPAATDAFISDFLKVKAEELATRMRRNKTALYRPVVIKEDVGIEDISVAEVHRRDHPEIQLGPEPRRLYRFRGLAAHLLGYVGEISEDELAHDTYPESKSGDLVGKYGVERIYNRYLTGQDGRRQVLVDSLGREVGSLEEIDPQVGGELTLTIDMNLQMIAEILLEGKVGTIIAMDPRNGEILAMASSPTFDPNNFSTRISEEDWSDLVNNPDRPLQNRAIQNTYSPGSVFKLVMTEAGLQEGIIDDDSHVVCRGAAVFYNRIFHCAKKEGHGYLNLETAIAKSCNIFFYELGRKMGISKIAQHAHDLGLGERTGIDLPGEKAGVMPSPEWKQQTRGTKWYAGETISVAIGQGQISVTPLQIVRAVGAIATDGKLVTPHVLLNAERATEATQWGVKAISLDPENARKIRQGMWSSVNNFGTSHSVAIPGLDICGKTGTVQVISNERKKEIQADASSVEDHSWFAGFASRDNPEIVVAVMIEHGGKGGIAAAPLAKEIFQAYFQKKQRPEMMTQITPTVAANVP